MFGRLIRVAVRQYSKPSIASSELRFGRVNTENLDESLFYAVRGNGPHTVLLLPGALGSGMVDLRAQLEGMDGGKYTLVALDPRGYGKSQPPFKRDFPVDFYERDAADAHRAMVKLGFGGSPEGGEGKQYSVLGWSDGAISAMILAGTQPSAVRKLVIWGGNAYVDRRDLQCYEAVRDVSKWSSALREPLERMYGAERFRTMWTTWCDAMLRIYEERRNGDICSELLPRITCNTLLLHGDCDPLVPNHHPVYLKSAIPHVRYHNWRKGKHNIHVKFAAEFNSIVQKFLDE